MRTDRSLRTRMEMAAILGVLLLSLCLVGLAAWRAGLDPRVAVLTPIVVVAVASIGVYSVLCATATSARDAARQTARATALGGGAPDAMLLLGRDGRITAVNPACGALAGCAEEGLLGRSIDETGLFPERALCELRRWMGSAQDSRGAQMAHAQDTAFDVTLAVPAECPARVEVRLRQYGGTDEVQGTHLTLRDISGTLRERACVQELQDRLAASRREEAIGRLAGGVAHDCSNLLTVVLGQIELLPRDDPRVNEPARLMEEAARRTGELVYGLLRLGGRRQGRLEKVDLRQRVCELETTLRALLPSKVMLRVLVREGTPVVAMNPHDVDQILMHLVVHARDRLPAGGRIDIETGCDAGCDAGCESGRESGRERGDEPSGESGDSPAESEPVAWLSVADDGAAIPAELHSRVFEPFLSTRADSGGTGIHLAAVHGVIAACGGDARLETGLRRGARLVLRFPACGSETTAAADAHRERALGRVPAHRPAAPRCGRILRVVTDAADCDAAALLLRHAGHEVHVAEGVLSVFEQLHAGLEPDVIVMDALQPARAARGLVSELHHQRPSTPILLCTPIEDFERALELTGVSPLPVPFSAGELLAAVQRKLPPELDAQATRGPGASYAKPHVRPEVAVGRHS